MKRPEGTQVAVTVTTPYEHVVLLVQLQRQLIEGAGRPRHPVDNQEVLLKLFNRTETCIFIVAYRTLDVSNVAVGTRYHDVKKAKLFSFEYYVSVDGDRVVIPTTVVLREKSCHLLKRNHIAIRDRSLHQ